MCIFPRKGGLRVPIRLEGMLLGMFVCSAIANTRICGYDGRTVTFWYLDNDGVKHVVSMGVFAFIEALIQHIADRQFKMIRYYGAYARKWKSRFRLYVYESITQLKIE